jgi:hypothetical protein
MILGRRRFLRLGLLGAAGLAVGDAHAAAEGELLSNGVRLPSPWPPRLADVPREPVEPPYLAAPQGPAGTPWGEAAVTAAARAAAPPR